MRVMRMAIRGAALGLTVAAAAGCENRIPTATGDDLFPANATPATVLLELPAAEFVTRSEIFDDYTDPRSVPYLVVANRFEGVLDARALARFTGIPDSVTYTSAGAPRTDRQFAYAPSQVVARVDSLASFPRAPTTFRLYALTQPFDSATVTWTNAVDQPGNRVAWRTPGGALGRVLAEAVWVPGDTTRRDSIVFQLDSLTAQQLAAQGHPGVAVTSENPNSRIQLSRLGLQLRVRPAGRPDTVLAMPTVTTGPQVFIANPPPPRSAGVLRVGGLTQARAVFGLDLDRGVPGCASPATTPGCPTVPLSQVTVNRAELIFTPVPVPNGYRPLTPTRLVLRRLAEPELGRAAPLSELLAETTAAPSLFDGTDRTLAINITDALVRAAADADDILPVALLASEEVPGFGYLWFAGAPRLRILYTLPKRPTLP